MKVGLFLTINQINHQDFKTFQQQIANQPDHKAIQVKLAEAECGSLSVYVGHVEETARVEVGEGWL